MWSIDDFCVREISLWSIKVFLCQGNLPVVHRGFLCQGDLPVVCRRLFVSVVISLQSIEDYLCQWWSSCSLQSIIFVSKGLPENLN
jgi:hypothetical protein